MIGDLNYSVWAYVKATMKALKVVTARDAINVRHLCPLLFSSPFALRCQLDLKVPVACPK